ncbi:AlpA family transcriptional regulator [Serratia sp. P2ACOL2]|uniref:helix-turn-helix transcriptional regulator n=1 Tax=Serratia sp. P2ACOL2 TaxID=2482769 RepID=UPI000EFD1A72|nr:AlpA family phage regulatory protein [Serratia sp. P2ACOL2]AYO37196.1 AlpA family phage regulatory protein [Serratia sp. P2ACOL2]
MPNKQIDPLDVQPIFITPTSEQRRAILAEYGERTDRNTKEPEREHITGISRSTAHVLEQKGLFPARRHIGRRTCAWLLSDLLWWIRNPPAIGGVHNPHERRKAKAAAEAN